MFRGTAYTDLSYPLGGHAILTRYHGVRILQMFTRKYRDATIRLDKNLRQRQDRIATNAESNLKCNLFADENDLRRFFDRTGLRIQGYQYSNAFHDLSSIKLFNLSQKEMKKALERLAASRTLILTARTDIRFPLSGGTET